MTGRMNPLARHHHIHKTPQWKIDAAQAMYRDDMSTATIAAQLDMGVETVRRYCANIDIPVKAKPLTNAERHRFMVNWRLA